MKPCDARRAAHLSEVEGASPKRAPLLKLAHQDILVSSYSGRADA